MRKLRLNDPKTSVIGLIILLIVLLAMVLVYTGKATLTEASAFVGGIASILAAIGFHVSGDSKKREGNYGE